MKINIKPFWRRLAGGKLIKINSHSRRAAILRAKEALKDLQKSKVEAGYLMSKSGKLSKKYSSNEAHSLAPIIKGRNIYHAKGVSAGLHNHPTAFSPPSGSDFRYAIDKKTQELVISKDGSMFRIASNTKSWDGDSTKKMIDEFYQLIKADISVPTNYPRQIKQEWFKHKTLLSEDPKTFSPAYGLAVRDYGLRKINQSKRIKYRSKLSPEVKDLQERHLDHIKSLYERSDLWKKFEENWLIDF